MTLWARYETIMRAAQLRIVALPESDRVRSDRSSAGGRIAADTLRRLLMLVGNGLTAEMTAQGLGDLLGLLSSPSWLANRATIRARSLAFDIGRDRWDAWAQPVGMVGGGDSTMRGVPGGAAVSAVTVYRQARAIRPMDAAQRATAAWSALASAADSWTRAAMPVVGLLTALSEGRDPDGIAAAQTAAAAVRRAFAEELEYLATPEGQQSTRPVVVIDAEPAPFDQVLPTFGAAPILRRVPTLTGLTPGLWLNGPDLTAPDGANARTGDGDMNEELIASSGLTADQIQEAADYNSGALRYRLTPAFEEYVAEERAALIGLYQIEVFGAGSAVDGKYGPATDAKAQADRDAWLADPTRSDWGERWDAWLFWDEGPPAPDAPTPTPDPAPAPSPAPEPRAEVDPPNGGGGGGGGVVPPVEPTPKAKKKSGGMLAWGLGILGVGAIAIGAMTSGGKKRRRNRRRGR